MSAADIAWVVVAMFMFVLVAQFLVNVVDTVQTQDADIDLSYSRNALVLTGNQIAVFVFVGLLLIVALLAFFTPSHPILYIFLLLGLLVLLFIVPSLSNTYIDIISTDAISTTTAEFSMVGLLMKNLPKIVIIFGILILAALAGKSGGASFG